MRFREGAAAAQRDGRISLAICAAQRLQPRPWVPDKNLSSSVNNFAEKGLCQLRPDGINLSGIIRDFRVVSPPVPARGLLRTPSGYGVRASAQPLRRYAPRSIWSP
jgi:hypothetical protein